MWTNFGDNGNVIQRLSISCAKIELANYADGIILVKVGSKHVLMTRSRVAEEKLRRMRDGEDGRRAEMEIEIIEQRQRWRKL